MPSRRKSRKSRRKSLCKSRKSRRTSRKFRRRFRSSSTRIVADSLIKRAAEVKGCRYNNLYDAVKLEPVPLTLAVSLDGNCYHVDTVEKLLQIQNPSLTLNFSDENPPTDITLSDPLTRENITKHFYGLETNTRHTC